LEEKGNTPKDSWRNGFMLKGYVQCVICMEQQKNEGMIKQRWLFLAEQEQAPFCKCGAIPLRLAFLQKLLQKC